MPLYHTLSPGLVLLGILAAPAFAQGGRADYERANGLWERTRGAVFKAGVEPRWLAGDHRFWYRNDLPGGRREFVLVDARAGTRTPAFDHARVAAALGKGVSPDRLPIERIAFSEDDPEIRLYGGDRAWRYDPRTHVLRAEKDAPPEESSLPVLDAPRPSRRTGGETSIRFVNRTAGEVSLFWIDPEGERRPYGTIRAGERREQHTFAGHVWLAADREGRPIAAFEAREDRAAALIGGPPAAAPPRAPRPSRARGIASPDGRWTVFVREYNLWLRSAADNTESALTEDGTAEDAYTAEAAWSPDGKKLAALRTRRGEDRKVYLVESSPKDRLQPRLHTLDYAKPGDRIAVSRPYLFDIASRRSLPISDTLFPNPWSITDLRWERDGRRFTFLYNQRGHQALRIVAVDAATGRTEAVVDERSDTFIDYSGKLFVRYLNETNEIVWASERDGWNHLYLYDARTGRVKRQITRGPWVVRGVDRIDEGKRQIWFRAGGIHPKQDPYHVHYCRVNFDGSGLIALTEGDGTHTVAPSPDGRYFLDTYSRVDLPPVIELRRSEDGGRVLELERADISGLRATGWRVPERFAAKGRDGRTDIYGLLFRPTNFDPAKKYPVIEQIYAGPQSAHVPKAFSAFHGAQQMAELGFIVVQIDGMGTNWRSKAFHDVAWKNLADAGFPDRIAWIRAAAAKYPELDLSRVGIYGTSAGGQNALGALLLHPDFYHAGVADCGCHDNRMDKIWWNEQWMGWPVGPHYAAQSNVVLAPRLRGKLLLMVGEMDTNVDPASTLQVADALIRADRDFDLLLAPGVGHGVAGTPYGRRRMQDFFVRHLLGVEPRR